MLRLVCGCIQNSHVSRSLLVIIYSTTSRDLIGHLASDWRNFDYMTIFRSMWHSKFPKSDLYICLETYPVVSLHLPRGHTQYPPINYTEYFLENIVRLLNLVPIPLSLLSSSESRSTRELQFSPKSGLYTCLET